MISKSHEIVIPVVSIQLPASIRVLCIEVSLVDPLVPGVVRVDQVSVCHPERTSGRIVKHGTQAKPETNT